MADLSTLAKVQIGSTTYDLKDAFARASMATLVSGHTFGPLGAAAWLGIDSSVTVNGAGAVTGSAIYSYVSGEMAKINKFDVVIDEASTVPGHIGEPATVASATTMYKIYLVHDDDVAAGYYIEWLTIRNGTEGSYTYAWEKIGSTKTDLSGYVPITRKIAGIGLSTDITDTSLITALGLKALAFKSTASGSYTPVGTVSVSNALPSGTVTLNAFTQTATAATISRGAYTPAGTITMSPSSIALPTSAALSQNDSGVQIGGTINTPGISLTFSSKTVLISATQGTLPQISFNAFSGGAHAADSFTPGTLPTFTPGAFSGGSLGNATKSSFVTSAYVISVNSSAETLIFSAAPTASAVTEQGAFSPATHTSDTFGQGTLPSFTQGTFTPASFASSFFNPGTLPTFTSSSISLVTAAQLDANLAFTGSKYAVNLGTTPTSISATFSGTTVSDALVTGVTYSKATANGATFSGNSQSLSATFTGSASTITVS